MGLLIASCQKAELVDSAMVENPKTYSHIITAGVDEVETKVGFDEDGAFYWHKDDQIAVETINEIEGEEGIEIMKSFTAMGNIDEEPELEEGEEPAEDAEPLRTMRFGTEYLYGEVGTYALYPANYNHRFDDDKVIFNLPDFYMVTVDKNGQTPTNAAMWAEIVDG